MEPIASRKYHFAPLKRQQRRVERLVREKRFRTVTEFMRAAIDHYLDAIGRPTLSQQARDMADDWAAGRSEERGEIQAESMESDEEW